MNEDKRNRDMAMGRDRSDGLKGVPFKIIVLDDSSYNQLVIGPSGTGMSCPTAGDSSFVNIDEPQNLANKS